MKNLTGQKFGRWAVIKLNHVDKNYYRYFLCKCECGKEKIVIGNTLRGGQSKSCGCLTREMASKSNTTHGMSKTRIWGSWQSLKQRCNNPRNKAYPNYGGRGINYEESWEIFENFYEDMGKEYKEHVKKYGENNTFIERNDNNLGYSKSNCSWKTRKEQNNNQRSNVLITYNGKTQNIKQWSDETGIKYNTLYHRITRLKWPPIKKVLTN